MTRRILLGVMMLMAMVSAASAGPRRRASAPIQIEMDTFIGPLPSGVVAEATWHIKVRRSKYDMQIVKLRVVSGNTSPSNVLEAVTPTQRASFNVVGEDADLNTIANAKPGEPHRITAYFRLDARTLMVSRVE